MTHNFTIVPPFKLYPVATGCYIVAGTPFLYLKDVQTLILGDIHLGHEVEIYGKDSNKISPDCKDLTELITSTCKHFNISKVICNGDVKHSTNSIKIQELEELKYLVSEVTALGIVVSFIKGNHDRLLEFLLPHIDNKFLELDEFIRMEVSEQHILIHHGHLDLNSQEFDLVLISHEHPAYTFRGFNRAKMKLPAFVMVHTGKANCIILPAANAISSGTNYPIWDRSKFLSPYLQKHARLETMEIFPNDREMGLLELPPVRQWSQFKQIR